MLRPDLDGGLVGFDDEAGLWLIFHGKRHHVVSIDVLAALFVKEPKIDTIPSAVNLPNGGPLGEGTCLARSSPSSPIYLVTISDGKVNKYEIPTYESFQEFNFSDEAVLTMPKPILDLIPGGQNLTGARARAGL